MIERRRIRSPRLMSARIRVLVLAPALFLSFSYGQQSSAPQGAAKPNVNDVITKASEDAPGAGYYVEQAVHLNAVQAIPAFEQKFARNKDTLDKVELASALVRLGDKDQTYWNYLAERANAALESDAPTFMSYDSQGKAKPGPSPEFQQWAHIHQIPIEAAAQDSMAVQPAEIGFLAQTMDKRAIPILRQALLSRNYMMEIVAANGLAKLQDKSSIPLIIEACRHAPSDAASVIAESLVYFDDPDAQNAVDTFLTKDQAKIMREARAKGKKPLS